MENWQYKINIKSIHDKYQETNNLDSLKASMAEECRLLAQRVRLAPDVKILGVIGKHFKAAQDINEYDAVLDELYNWGDYNHKCWIGTF